MEEFEVKPKRKKRTPQEVREYQAEISREKSAAAREIGPLPEIINSEHRQAALDDPYVFMETYGSELFTDPFSLCHRMNIDTVTKTKGSLKHVVNMPRRWGKTTTLSFLFLWFILRGDIKFLMIIAANEENAHDILSSLLVELETNDLLYEDFPEVCHSFRMLEGTATRGNAQTFEGERTRVKIGADQIVFPTIPGSTCAGSIIRSLGIYSKQLGARVRNTKGAIRPDAIWLDDVQDEESSMSFSRTEKLEKQIEKTLKYLPDKKTPPKIVITCTVRNQDDVADRRLKNPKWTGKRQGAFDKIPSDFSPWRRYDEEHLRLLERHSGEDPDTASEKVREGVNAYYLKNREELDAGFEPHWEYAKWDFQISATQALMENFLENESSFWSEDMNSPLAEIMRDTEDLDIDAIMARRVPFPRGWIPGDTTKLVASIDVHHHMLTWMICSGNDSFSIHVVDYGVWPKQNSNAVVYPENVSKKIGDVFPGKAMEESIYEAFTVLVPELLERKFRNEDGSTHSVSRLFIDAKEGNLTATIRKFCKNSLYSGVVIPSFSFDKSLCTGTKKMNARWGREKKWEIPPAKNGEVRHMLYSGNYWKTFQLARIQASLGSPSALSIFNGDRHDHAQLISDWTAEYHEKVYTKTGVETVWKDRPRMKNRSHLWDNLTHCVVALSEQGIYLATHGPEKEIVPTISFSELAIRAKDRRENPERFLKDAAKSVKNAPDKESGSPEQGKPKEEMSFSEMAKQARSRHYRR